MGVTIYTSPTCGYCVPVKKYFAMKGVEYTEKDITNNEYADELSKLTNGDTRLPTVLSDKGIAIGANIPSVVPLI